MSENKYPIGGYAPGNYTCICCICKKKFQGDKRAVQCEECATKAIANKYDPIGCQHKLGNGFSAWSFQSEEQSNLGGQNKVSIHVCLLCGEINIGGYRPSKDEKHVNSFHETFHIYHPDAIDAIIKQANFFNEESKWGRVSDKPAGSAWVKASRYVCNDSGFRPARIETNVGAKYAYVILFVSKGNGEAFISDGGNVVSQYNDRWEKYEILDESGTGDNKDVIEFAEWILEEEYYGEDDKWWLNAYSEGAESFTTAHLYQLWQQSKSK